MDGYQATAVCDSPVPANVPDVVKTVKTAVDEVTRTARRLIPFPGSPTHWRRWRGRSCRAAPGGATPSPACCRMDGEQHAAGLIAEAASILDLEMAKGVLAAAARGPRRYGTRRAAIIPVRQVHDWSTTSRAWPSLE